MKMEQKFLGCSVPENNKKTLSNPEFPARRARCNIRSIQQVFIMHAMRLKWTKIDFGWDSAPDPAEAVQTLPPDYGRPLILRPARQRYEPKFAMN